MRSDFSTSFTRDMAPELAKHYLGWLPFGREAIATTIREFVKPDSLKQFLGLNGNIDDSEIATSHGAWLDPWQPYLQRTGKMLRPYLTSFSLEAYGRDPKDYPHQVAMAEFVHSSSLILDDIVDDSRFRRGGPSAHSQVGVLAAGAAGSVWLNLGFEIVWRDRVRLGERAARRIIEELAWEHFVTGLGTTLDLTWPLTGGGHTANEYLQEIMHRSASYTYRLPLKIGALAAGADDAEVAKLATFGQQVGLAFQIIDDVLNVSSTDKHWGKEIAEDITQGKITLQVILAREHGTEKQRTRLSQILASGSRDPDVLAEAVSILEATGGLEGSRSIAAALQAEALSIVDSLQISESHRSRLREFTDYVLRRTR
jgi:geranylgeranyl pyrophosphate synthase